MKNSKNCDYKKNFDKRLRFVDKNGCQTVEAAIFSDSELDPKMPLQAERIHEALKHVFKDDLARFPATKASIVKFLLIRLDGVSGIQSGIADFLGLSRGDISSYKLNGNAATAGLKGHICSKRKRTMPETIVSSANYVMKHEVSYCSRGKKPRSYQPRCKLFDLMKVKFVKESFLREMGDLFAAKKELNLRQQALLENQDVFIQSQKSSDYTMHDLLCLAQFGDSLTVRNRAAERVYDDFIEKQNKISKNSFISHFIKPLHVHFVHNMQFCPICVLLPAEDEDRIAHKSYVEKMRIEYKKSIHLADEDSITLVIDYAGLEIGKCKSKQGLFGTLHFFENQEEVKKKIAVITPDNLDGSIDESGAKMAKTYKKNRAIGKAKKNYRDKMKNFAEMQAAFLKNKEAQEATILAKKRKLHAESNRKSGTRHSKRLDKGNHNTILTEEAIKKMAVPDIDLEKLVEPIKPTLILPQFEPEKKDNSITPKLSKKEQEELGGQHDGHMSARIIKQLLLSLPNIQDFTKFKRIKILSDSGGHFKCKYLLWTIWQLQSILKCDISLVILPAYHGWNDCDGLKNETQKTIDPYKNNKDYVRDLNQDRLVEIANLSGKQDYYAYKSPMLGKPSLQKVQTLDGIKKCDRFEFTSKGIIGYPMEDFDEIIEWPINENTKSLIEKFINE